MRKRLFYPLPVLAVVFFVSLFMLSANDLFAQESEPQIRISVRIIETGYHNIDDKGKNKFIWKFYSGTNINDKTSLLINSKSESCFLVKSRKDNVTKEISDSKDNLTPFYADISGFYITMVAFQNKKGGEKCDVDPKDTYYSIKTEYIKPDKLPSDDWNNEIKIVAASGHFDATIAYKYEVQRLGIIEFTGGNAMNDASKNMSLSLPIKLPQKETLPFSWSYSIGDEENWNTLPNSAEDQSTINFNPLKTIFRNKQLTRAQKVNFKAEVQTGGKTVSTNILEVTMIPPPPTFVKEKDLHSIPVCNGLANGSVEIKNIQASASEIKYVLRRKTETEMCDLNDASVSTCPDFVGAGKVSANKTLKIKNLAAGEYLLYIFNADLESGEVNTVTQFTITELTPFKILDTNPSTISPTCENPKGGEIYMTVEGAENLWQIAMIPNKGTFHRDGKKISFKNLEAGKYTVYLSDRCGPEKWETYILKKPKQISIGKDINQMTDKTGSYILLTIVNGENDYKVKITDPDNTVSETAYSFLADMKIPIGKIGTYAIEVTDVSIPKCPPATVKIKVDKSPNPKREKFKITVLDQ